MNSKTKRTVMAAIFAALVFIATIIVKIPSPFKGYMNLGDCVVLLSGWFLSPFYSFFAAGIGSSLADIYSGYAIYAPVTFLIKGLMAVCAYIVFNTTHKHIGNLPSHIISGISAEVIMVFGYYIFEGFLYGFILSLASIPANVVQGAVGLILGVLLVKILKQHIS